MQNVMVCVVNVTRGDSNWVPVEAIEKLKYYVVLQQHVMVLVQWVGGEYHH